MIEGTKDGNHGGDTTAFGIGFLDMAVSKANRKFTYDQSIGKRDEAVISVPIGRHPGNFCGSRGTSDPLCFSVRVFNLFFLSVKFDDDGSPNAVFISWLPTRSSLVAGCTASAPVFGSSIDLGKRTTRYRHIYLLNRS